MSREASKSGKDEEEAVLSLLQIKRAPSASSGDEGSETKGRPPKKHKITEEDDDDDISPPPPTNQPTRCVSGEVSIGREEEQPGDRLQTIHEAIRGLNSSAGAEASETKDKPEVDVPAELRRLQLERELALRAALERSNLEQEIALRALGQSPLDTELALRATLAGANPFNPLAAAASAGALGMSAFPGSQGLLASGLFQQQRARQLQLEMLRAQAQFAAVEEQRLQRLALLGATPGSATALSASLSGIGAASLPASVIGQPTAAAAATAARANGDRPGTPPDIAKDKIKPAMKPSNEAKKPENQRLCTRTKFRYEHYTPPTSWSELTDVPKIDPVPADDDMKNPIGCPGEHDVLFGRGGATNMHTGNVNFRNLVQKYRAAYCTVPKGDKGALARFLCNYVRAKKGRFLRQDSDKNWYEVGDEKAICKCGQALREGSAEFLKSKNAASLQQQKCGLPMRLFLGDSGQPNR